MKLPLKKAKSAKFFNQTCKGSHSRGSTYADELEVIKLGTGFPVKDIGNAVNLFIHSDSQSAIESVMGPNRESYYSIAIKIKYKLHKNYFLLAYDEKVPRRFWKMAIVTGILPSRDSEIKGAIGRIKKTNPILKHPINKLFPIEYTYHDTNQTDKARAQKLRWEAAVIGELNRKYEF